MYTTTGEKMSWSEFEARRKNGEQIYVGNYPSEDKRRFKEFAYTHTKKEVLDWLNKNDFSLDIMYTDGRPDCYDKWNGECAGIRCKDGYLWN